MKNLDFSFLLFPPPENHFDLYWFFWFGVVFCLFIFCLNLTSILMSVSVFSLMEVRRRSTVS